MSTRDDDKFTEDTAAQQDRLDAELDTHEEHLEQEDRDTGRGEDLEGRMDSHGKDEEPPEGAPDHDRGIISGS